MEMVAGDYESEAVQQVKDDYPDVYDGILKMLTQGWHDKESNDFKKEYPDIYSGVKKIAERERGLAYASEDGEEIAEAELLHAEDARAEFYEDLKQQVTEEKGRESHKKPNVTEMNPLTRYFLPSQVRGVYRFDDTFASVVDGDTYVKFVNSKFRFLPSSLIEPIRSCVNLSDNFNEANQQLHLRNTPHDPQSRRAKSFFAQHPYFANADNCEEDPNWLEVQFVRKILAPLLNEAGLASLQPQKKIGRYDVDFALESPMTKLVLEVDGFGKFSHRKDLDGFIERQNYLIFDQGWKVIRFTYGMIMHTTKRSVRALHDLFKADLHFRGFLSSNQGEELFDGLRDHTETGLNVFDVVNGFYHIQDWFAEFAITREDAESTIMLRDEFDFPFPFVALAVSSLYHFLDAVAGVVDVEFKLPAITVIESSLPPEWRPHLHPSISITSSQQALAISVNSNIVQTYSASQPAPLRSEELISFRKGLSLEEIHQRLKYITTEVFGYEDGTNRFQDKVLQRIFDGNETLGISATGNGKSFCFWLPSLLMPGLTLVIAPLRSLMRDQKLTLLNYGIASMEFIDVEVKAPKQRRFIYAIYGFCISHPSAFALKNW